MTAISCRRNFAFLIVLAVLLAAACSSVREPPLASVTGEGRDIFIVHDNWHAAIVVRKMDLSGGLIPEIEDFPGAEYLEFSWGDTDYFQTPEAGFRLALRAAFWSRGSVLHLVGINRPLQEHFHAAEIIRVPISDEAFQHLTQFLSNHFARAESGARATPRPGLARNGRFYRSIGKFNIVRTCNTWVAEALEYAGLPVKSGFVITAANLAGRVRPLGFVIE
jgi:uncharacterized protein (TIGR02117 family)